MAADLGSRSRDSRSWRIGSSETSATSGSAITCTSSNGALLGGAIDVENHTAAERLGLDQVQEGVAGEQGDALAQHYRMDGQVVAVDESFGRQRTGEAGPAGNTDRAALLPQAADLFGWAALRQPAVLPSEIFGPQRLGEHHLLDRVHDV